MDTTDRIEKQIVLRAPIQRVWKALSDVHEFGRWFGMRGDGPFEPGRHIHATVVPTEADEQVAKMQKPYEGFKFDMFIERMDPERFFSFRWTHDVESTEASPPSTLVEFTLTQRDDGVLLTITESGFEQIPVERRAKMFTENQEGWRMQVKLLEAHLATNP
jgi:uncharacterized protein YndB with AHSA1/START domain